MGLSLCSEAPRDKLWLWHGDFSGNAIHNEAPGVRVAQVFMKNKFRNEAYEGDNVYINEKESTEVTDFAIRHMLKTNALRPRTNITSKSETVWRHKDFRIGLSHRRKMLERRRNSFHKFVEGKHEGHLNVNALENSSMEELTLTYKNAEAMLEKGNKINEELRRQGKIVKQASGDSKAIEKDLNDTSHRLKGIKCLSGKFKNIIWHHHRNPGVAVHESDDESVAFERSSRLPARLSSYHTKITKQEWINKGVNQLCHVLEEVEHRQKDMAKELGEQEKHFQCLDHNIDHIEYKINRQTKSMRNITKK